MKQSNNIARISLVVFSIFILSTACSKKAETVADEFCNCLEENQGLPEAVQLEICRELLGKIVCFKDDEKIIKEKLQRFDSLLQVQCNHYSEILRMYSYDNGQWTILESEKETELSEEQCSEFWDYSNFYYLESNGDTTHLKIVNDLWIDNFNEGQYFSYLKVHRKSRCEFDIELIETTEPIRKVNFKSGDIFNYRILNKDEGYFLMMVVFEESKQEFKLYVN